MEGNVQVKETSGHQIKELKIDRRNSEKDIQLSKIELTIEGEIAYDNTSYSKKEKKGKVVGKKGLISGYMFENDKFVVSLKYLFKSSAVTLIFLYSKYDLCLNFINIVIINNISSLIKISFNQILSMLSIKLKFFFFFF